MARLDRPRPDADLAGESLDDDRPSSPAALSSSSTKVRLLTAALFVATFAAGTAFGAGLFVVARPFSEVGPGRGHGPPGPGGPGPFGGRPPFPLPLGELELTPAQEAETHRIFEKHRPELDAILKESYPRVRAINERIEADVRKILTAEQIRKLDEMPRHRPPAPGEPPPFAPGSASGDVEKKSTEPR
jgi:Spy/CpxP family protein refolding chaperone